MASTLQNDVAAWQPTAGNATAVDCDSDCYYCFGAETD